MKIKRSQDFLTREWTGGITTELLILPEEADYGRRDFDLRLSVATLPEEESLFTSLPRVARTLLLLEGSTILTVQGKEHPLTPGMQQSFQGEDVTTSNGAGVDFNLMLCKDTRATLNYRILDQGEQIECGLTYIHSGTALVEESNQSETVTGPCLVMGECLTISSSTQLIMVEVTIIR